MAKKKAARVDNAKINQALNFHMKTRPFIPIHQPSSSLSDRFHDDKVDINLDDNISSLALTDESKLSEQKQATRHDNDNNDISLSPLSAVNNDTKDDTPYSGKASLISCAINLCNTVVGAGMLGLPSGFASSGYLGGIMFLCVASFFSAMGLRMLSMSAATVGIRKDQLSSFYSVANAAIPGYTILIDFAVALKCFGVATGYFITVGDCMVDALEYFLPNVTTRHAGGNFKSWEWEELLISRHFWILIALFTVLPISFFKTINALRGASSLSLVIIYGLVVMVVLYAHDVFDPCEGYDDSIYGNATALNNMMQSSSASADTEERMEFFPLGQQVTASPMSATDMYNSNSTIDGEEEVCQGETMIMASFSDGIKNLAIFVFSFTCHQNIFSVVNEISNRSQKRVDIVIALTIISALLIYSIVSINGYHTYGSEVKGDILLNYPETFMVSCMRIALSIMVLLSYPLQLDPSRRCITSMVNSCSKWHIKCEERNQDAMNAEIEEEIKKDGSLYIDNIIRTEDIDDTTSLEDDDDSSYYDEIFMDEDEEAIDNEKLLQEISENFLFNGITITFLVLSFLIAMCVSDLSLILSIVGATGSTIVSYILPGLIYIRLHKGFHLMKIMAYLQLILGLIIVPSALYFVFFCGASA